MRLLWAGQANFRDHAIINPANFATLSSWRILTPLAGANLGNPTFPRPCGAGHLSHRLRRHATVTGFRRGHPGHSCRDVIEDFGRSREAGESVTCNRHGNLTIVGALASSQRRIKDWPSAILRPFLQESESISQASDFLYPNLSRLDENRSVESPVVH